MFPTPHYTPIGIALCVIGTLAMIAGTCNIFGLGEGTTRFEPKKDIPYILAYGALFFCVWWSVPFAWARGFWFDPVITVISFIFIAAFVISGAIESQSAYDKRSGRRR